MSNPILSMSNPVLSMNNLILNALRHASNALRQFRSCIIASDNRPQEIWEMFRSPEAIINIKGLDLP